jgi:hypothetical protein
MMQLEKNWKKSWKWFSVQALVLAASLQTAWAALPEDMKGSLSPGLVSGLTIGVLVLGVIGRLINQESANAE